TDKELGHSHAETLSAHRSPDTPRLYAAGCSMRRDRGTCQGTITARPRRVPSWGFSYAFGASSSEKTSVSTWMAPDLASSENLEEF
ncbi:MAG: hypothetical protein ACXWDJ_11180, partial [Aeromicrobium sp.]